MDCIRHILHDEAGGGACYRPREQISQILLVGNIECIMQNSCFKKWLKLSIVHPVG
jgi:hypothetical protein